jgi:two-component system chemotaxis response regulator CheY
MIEELIIDTKNVKVLLVEDSDEIRRLIKVILESKFNFVILEASNGKEALQILNQENIFLVITDLMMPEMSGIELVKNIRQNEKIKDLNVIVSTSLDDKEIVLDLINQGVTDYILKPIRPIQLTNKITEFLKKHQEKKIVYPTLKSEPSDTAKPIQEKEK